MNALSEPSSSPPASRRSGGKTLYYIQVVLGVAFVVATLFTTWIPTGLLPESLPEPEETVVGEDVSQTAVPAPTLESLTRIGIIAGHWGSDPYDPGAVCPDALGGVKEVDVNYGVAVRVQQMLGNQGYEADLLKEWDERLNGYRALALVAIHTDSCEFVNREATGFKVAPSASNDLSARLANCLQDRYAQATQMGIHPGVTTNMTYYHAFYSVDGQTPAAIIELGFLNLDYDKLIHNQEEMALGISNGILCFVRNEPINPQVTSTPLP